ncbi:putative TBCC domain-containing protein 1 [Blattamonas nauphoetae]|uniref:TBCC domain-containing protein 1 n=1 Tax=Blattamonas nauphoetae TaxID=2049346 RepID=A0ABQ9YK65_9EUKA|nr:putative TBCC domain-containing protein 1 [Blattamonas nauphoetae]
MLVDQPTQAQQSQNEPPFVWVKTELFDLGVLPPPHRSNLEPQVLFPFLETFYQTHGPEIQSITLSEWIALSKVTFNLNDQNAKLYFEFFQLLCCEIIPGNYINSVDLPRFVMFLFLQGCAQRSVARHEMAGDSWPTIQNLRYSLQMLQNKLGADHSLHQYIVAHIKDTLFLLATCADPSLTSYITTTDQTSTSGSSQRFKTAGRNGRRSRSLSISFDAQMKAMLRAESFDALSVILSGGETLQKEELHLSSLTGFWNEDPDKDVPVSAISEWLTAHLCTNTVRYPPIQFQSTPGSLSSAVMPDSERENSPSSQSLGLTSTTISIPPQAPFPGCPLFISVNKMTTLHTPRELVSARLIGCSKSNIYVAGAVRDCSIVSCENCTIFLGAVSTVLMINHSSKLTVISTSGRIRANNSNDISLFSLTPSPLLISPSCKSVTLAPYNALYPTLQLNLATAHIDITRCTSWDKVHNTESSSADQQSNPLTFDSRKDAEPPSTTPQHCTPLPPSMFSLFSVPFTLSGDHMDLPPNLPDSYKEAVTRKNATLNQLRQNLSNAQFDQQTQLKIEMMVQRKFKEYLSQSGQLRQIHDLLHMNHTAPTITPSPVADPKAQSSTIKAFPVQHASGPQGNEMLSPPVMRMTRTRNVQP